MWSSYGIYYIYEKYISYPKIIEFLKVFLLYFIDRAALENYNFIEIKSVGEILSKYSNAKLNNEVLSPFMNFIRTLWN